MGRHIARWFLRIALLAFVASSSAESVQLSGRSIDFQIPAGFCAGGGAPNEGELARRTQAALGTNVQLAFWAAPCSELNSLRDGSREQLSHWIQVQFLGAKGEVRPVGIGKEQFLSAMAGAKPKLDITEANSRMQKAMDDSSARIDNAGVEIVSRDGNAVYMTTRSTVHSGGADINVRGVSAITILNSVPLSVNVYETTGTPQSRSQIQAWLKTVVESMLTQN